MTKYEYQTVTTDSVLMNDSELNLFGKNGWELCALYRKNDGNFIYHFKRVTEKKE